MTETTGPRLAGPLVVAVIGSAVWLVLDSSTWDVGQTWIRLVIGLVAPTLLATSVLLSATESASP